MEKLIAPSSFVALGVSFVVSVVVPVLLAIFWHKRTGAKWISMVVGMLIFPVFVFGLENIMHQFCIYQENAVSAFLSSHTIAYMLYGGLAAGVFEETGRYLAFKWFLKKQNGREAGVMYGIGHGGIESILICGVSMISNIAFCASLNAMGADALIAATPAAQQATVAATIETFKTITPGTLLLPGVERIIAIALHISLSVLVFTAVKRKKFWLYPVAILLHAGVDCFAILYQRGYITSMLLMELIIAVAVVFIGLWAARIYRKDQPAVAPEAAAEETL